MTTATPEYIIRAPELRGAVTELAKYPDLELGIDGPAGCVAGETRIYNPVTGAHTPIKELYEKKIAPTVQTLIGAIQAHVPFRKGVRKLYKVTLTSGRQCIVTENHIFLTSNGWDFLSSCAPGSHLLISSPCPYPTTEALGPSVSPQDALHLSQRPLNSQGRCYSSRYQYDGQPLMGEDSALTAVPSQGDVPVHSRGGPYEGDLDSLSEYSRPHQPSDHHARMCYSPLSDDRVCTLSHDRQETSLQVGASSRHAAQSQKEKRRLLPTAQSLLDGDNMRHCVPWLAERPLSLSHQRLCDEGVSIRQQLTPCSSSSDTTQEFADAVLPSDVCNLSNATSISCTNTYCTAQWDTVSSIEYVRTDEYFDLHVPYAEHYLAEGIWHHNTGKTFGILYFIHILLSAFPGAKSLVTRRYNSDLAGSAMATYQNEVLDPREGVHYFGGNKVKPPAFMYPNGSLMVVSGLDRPGRLKSFDADIIYINEATECEVEHIEFAHMRMARRGKSTLPERYQKLLLDFNPDHPHHFLNLRMNEGLTRRLLSRHEDNPFLWDRNTNDWTEAGRRYIGVLDSLTGVRYARYRLGLWAAAEGTVYQDAWDRHRNIVDRGPIPRDYPRYLIIDFGYTHPFVCLWAAVDPDGRLIIYRQLYHTKRLVEDHARQIALVSGWFHLLPPDHPKYQKRPAEWADPLPRDIICDHDAEDRATLERHLKLYTTPAKKTVSDGIQAVSSRFRAAGDGRARLVIMRDCLIERDPELVHMKRPTCVEEEPEVYVFKKDSSGEKEEPVKENDHGLDCIRYLCAYHDLTEHSVSYFRDIWK